jgi:hypothetical protein
MYNLIITRLTAQKDMQSLVKILLKVPGIDPNRVSKGLKFPPFEVLSVEKEEQAEKLKSVLEKLGAVCEIDNTDASYAMVQGKNQETEKSLSGKNKAKDKASAHAKHVLQLWIGVFTVMATMVLLTFFSPLSCDSKSSSKQSKTQTAKTTSIESPSEAPPGVLEKSPPIINIQRNNSELKKDIVKNPYNSEAWKALSENLEKEGDTASARVAKESYEKALKAQMVLASLAKAFGNQVRVEITENSVYYRTSKDFSDEEFHIEAAKLKDSLGIKFPRKDLIIENYTSKNKVQSTTLKYSAQPKEKDSPR